MAGPPSTKDCHADAALIKMYVQRSFLIILSHGDSSALTLDKNRHH
ncbi:unnamed protein product [Plutella xylostella]|uniref:(diamondback moth) hypothetical protein n=1 Tax=Plutella xylostella TaxID=51655 RepID=A0A8S4FCJ3_PLUXY|nr:unnamed protein product [Plutella xylostella]